MSGCGHCKKFTPQFQVSCIAFANEPHVTLAMLNGDDASDLREQLGVNGYPKLLMFPEVPAGVTKEPKVYEGPRKHVEVTNFVNEHAGTYRLVNGTLGTDAALVPALDAIVTTASAYDDAFVHVLEAAIAGLQQSAGWTKQAQQHAYDLYLQYARKTAAKGEAYPQQESQRLARLIANPTTSPLKAEQFQMKLNVVSKFLGGEFLSYTGEEGLGLVQTLDKMIAAAPALDDAFAAQLEAAAAELNMDTTQYVMYAKKIAGNGEGYLQKELKRLGGLLSSKSVLQHKKQGLQTRFNVLRQFQRLRRPQGGEEEQQEQQQQEL
mmetsp:Transcript_17826/g.33552  ORF Transcript_17826/g.33552 Transcript_17826/m.33552 type:complete len:321 (-) Transcript_17826:141-1103(-)